MIHDRMKRRRVNFFMVLYIDGFQWLQSPVERNQEVAGDLCTLVLDSFTGHSISTGHCSASFDLLMFL